MSMERALAQTNALCEFTAKFTAVADAYYYSLLSEKPCFAWFSLGNGDLEYTVFVLRIG